MTSDPAVIKAAIDRLGLACDRVPPPWCVPCATYDRALQELAAEVEALGGRLTNNGLSGGRCELLGQTASAVTGPEIAVRVWLVWARRHLECHGAEG